VDPVFLLTLAVSPHVTRQREWISGKTGTSDFNPAARGRRAPDKIIAGHAVQERGDKRSEHGKPNNPTPIFKANLHNFKS
jgi:hypothetical protein